MTSLPDLTQSTACKDNTPPIPIKRPTFATTSKASTRSRSFRSCFPTQEVTASENLVLRACSRPRSLPSLVRLASSVSKTLKLITKQPARSAMSATRQFEALWEGGNQERNEEKGRNTCDVTACYAQTINGHLMISTRPTTLKIHTQTSLHSLAQ